MKLINKLGLIILAVSSLFCSCSTEEAYLVRENDTLSFNCAEQAVEQSLQCSGAWEIDYNGNSWITVTPDSGVGNGSVEFVSVAVAYNRGEARTGTIYVKFNNDQYPIEVSQAACDFAFGTLTGEGSLVQGKEGVFTLSLPYVKAYGDESVELSCKMTGAADGLVANKVTYDKFVKGNGTIEYAITGTPTKIGDVAFELLVDGVSKGKVESAVIDPADVELAGLPVYWDFAHYDAGITVDQKKNALQGTQYDYSWGNKSLNSDLYASTVSTDHKILDWNFCDVNQAYFTVSGKITSYAYGEGHAYAKGMVHNDYWMIATKVRNLEAGTKLTFEAAIGCSGSGPKVGTLEYSVDGGKSWLEAAGGKEYKHPYTDDKANVHFEVFTDNQYVNKDKNQGVRNDKDASDGWAKVTFPVEKELKDGWLYVRIRYSLNLRLNHSATSYAIAATGSERVKNEVKLYVAEE